MKQVCKSEWKLASERRGKVTTIYACVPVVHCRHNSIYVNIGDNVYMFGVRLGTEVWMKNASAV